MPPIEVIVGVLVVLIVLVALFAPYVKDDTYYPPIRPYLGYETKTTHRAMRIDVMACMAEAMNRDDVTTAVVIREKLEAAGFEFTNAMPIARDMYYRVYEDLRPPYSVEPSTSGFDDPSTVMVTQGPP